MAHITMKKVLNRRKYCSLFLFISFSLVCGLNCHHKCEKKVSNLCGVNQKLLAEALESIRPNRQKQSAPASKSKTADGKTEVSELHHFYTRF